MKVSSCIILSAASAIAAPSTLDGRQLTSTRTDLEDGDSSSCPTAILIFARGSTEIGNMGSSVGPALASSLESSIDSIWIQGIGGPYDATIGDNALPGGTSQAAIREANRLYTMANQKCPNAAVVTGGYSQGAALVAGSVSKLEGAVQDQVKGAVLFGYTQNKQNDGKIPNYPPEETKVFCNQGDLVCEGQLIVAAPHLAYTSDARGPGADFLAQQIGSA